MGVASIFESEAAYQAHLTREAVLPDGIRAATVRLAFTPNERPTLEPYRMDLALLLLDEPTDAFAGVHTRSAFPGAPVLLARELLTRRTARGALINNKISNVCSPTGLSDARRLTQELARAAGIPAEGLYSVSTGIIGWSLPVREMVARLDDLVAGLHNGSAVDVARAIMTTDGFPKVRREIVGEGSLVGIAKGAGMIEPNMATMLVFLLTDLTMDRSVLRAVLPRVVERTFNCISVDSDQSTSDMAVLFATGRRPAVPESEFERALEAVCSGLAEDIVRNGEGTAHVLRVTVRGLPAGHARAAAKAVVNSPLVKTAMFGNDPNVGRIIGALGDYLGNAGVAVDPACVRVDLGPETVFDGGVFHIDREKEVRLSEYLKHCARNPRLRGYPQHQRCVAMVISCGCGSDAATVLGSDLSDQYVHENADYRS